MVDVYYRSHDEGEPINEAFFLLLQEVSRSSALVLLGHINHPNICWESSTASCRQSRTVLQCMENNFLSQVIDRPTTGEAILGLMSQLSEVNGDVERQPGMQWSCTDGVCSPEGYDCGKVRPLKFIKGNFQTFKEIVNRAPWETALRNKGVE